MKGDGQYTYFMPDIAYHRDKFNRGSLLIDILGADHHGYVGRMKAAVMALGHNPTDVEILIGQNCVLLRDGEVVKLSKRTGDIIELAEIIDEVGADAAKLTFLLQSIDTRQSVDLNAIVAQTLDNPVHYIHYAHARIHGISRKAAENGIKRELLGWVDLSQLSHESELNVARLLGDLNDVLTVAANDRAPHKVATWVRELAGAFQRMYHDCPILRSDVPDPLRQARLTLIEACRIGLAIGLDTLGVSAPERMDALETEDAVLSAAEVAEQAAAAAFPTAAVAMHLLPETASVGPNGRMLVAGVDMVGLAEEYGTPLFVYDEYHLRKRCRDAVQAFGSGVAYASKAFLCVAMAKLAHEEGMHIDVASAGEAYTALRAGVPAEKLVFHGNNKSTAELTYALEQGLGRIVIDCFEELERLKRLSNFGHRRPRVLLRLNPGVEAHTHEFIATGQEDSKFGFSISSGAARDAVFRARAADSGVELVGLHAHVGSNVTAIDSFEKIVGTLADFFLPLGLPELVIGGGLAAPYVNAEPAISITDWAAAVRNAAFEAGIPSSVLLAAEPGRSIVANAGMTLYRVGVIKDLPGIRTYVSIDGGMSDNIRPSLYGAQYEVFLPRAMQARREKQIRLVGKHCESGDIVAREAFVPNDIAVGDIVCTPVTGAYGYTMASNYNKLPRPAVVFVTEGRSRVVVRRESHEDLLRNDIF